jgi:hypothetical protein
METMQIKEYHITEDIKYFGELEPFKSSGLPTHSIIFKTLPGFGATFWEIYYSLRNSILIEPNIPVIEGKQSFHPNILAVYKKTSKARIKEYLDSDIYPKKIITTPESFITKVKPAIEKHSKFDLYKDFFALYDECDRLVTDVSYRGKITAPIDDFFKFTNMAMVSATPIIPSDQRFKQNGFKVVKIVPDFNYRKDINLMTTNNIVAALRYVLNKATDNPVFIFLNSTLTIYAIINLLDIGEEAKVFCAEDSISTLALHEFYNTSSKLGDFKKYNFLTSRCFSAVDINLEYKPDVIMITDVFQAAHSILDPITEVVQISGRFRKKPNSSNRVTTNSLTHITNLKKDIKFQNPLEAADYVNAALGAYESMSQKRKEDSRKGAIDTYTQGMENTEIKDFLNPDGTLDTYMFDNYLHQQRV